LTAWRTASDSSTLARPGITFGGALYPAEDRYQVTDAGVVREVLERLGT
jgi:hypothetical protein